MLAPKSISILKLRTISNPVHIQSGIEVDRRYATIRNVTKMVVNEIKKYPIIASFLISSASNSSSLSKSQSGEQ